MTLCILVIYQEFGIPDEEYARGRSVASSYNERTVSRANSAFSFDTADGYQGGNTHSIY